MHLVLSTFKRENEEPQINADERRFVNFKVHQSYGTHSETKLNKSTQSEAAKLFALPDRKEIQNRARLTQIARIFTDTSNPCASASSVQSVFYPKRFDPVSAFICVHLRLNEQDHTAYSGKWGEFNL